MKLARETFDTKLAFEFPAYVPPPKDETKELNVFMYGYVDPVVEEKKRQ